MRYVAGTGRSVSIFMLGLLLGAAVGEAQTVPPVVPGFPNVAQTPGTLLSGLNAPNQGRTAIIAYHNGILFTVPELPSSAPGSDFLVRTWDLADPTAPVQLATWGVSPMPINAHGYLKSGEYLVLGSNYPPESPWSFQAGAPGTVTRTMYPDLLCAGVRGCLFAPWFVGGTFWSYGEVSGNAFLELNGSRLSEWDHLGMTGVIGHPFLLGDLLIFASDQSRTGVATYDVSDPTNPVLLDVLTTGGPGGYWPEIWGGDGKLYIVFPYRTGGNGFRVVDATDPSNLVLVTDKPLPGDEAMYMQFQDEFAFIGDHKVSMTTLESVLFLDGANAVRPNDGGTGVSTSQFALPLGNLLVTGGIGPNQGMAIWAHQAAPDTRGPSVGFHIPQAGRTGYPVGAPISLLIHETLETATLVNGVSFIVRPLGGSAIPGRLTFSFDDVLTFTPDSALAADTTYEVVLPAGLIKDAAGNGMEAYSFTFSTGSTVGGNTPPTVTSFTASHYPAAPGQNVTLTAAGTDPEPGTLEYRFDFGDGSPRTAWSTSTSALHAYGGAGHYQATAQVRDAAGAVASSRLAVTVLTAPAGPFPTRSTPVHCDVAGRRVWVANPDNDTVSALDADTGAKELEVSVCADPRSVAESGTGEIWVSCHDDDAIQVLDAVGSFVAQIDLGYGAAPHGLAFTPDGATAYAALQGSGELRRFNAATRAETGSLPLGPHPRALAISGDGSRVLVTRLISGKDDGEVWDVATSTFTISRTLRLPKVGGETHRDGTADGKGTPNHLAGIALSPDGQSAWVTSQKANAERGLLFFHDLDQDNTVRNLASRIDLASGNVTATIDLDNSDSASAVAFSPLGDYLFVALQGNDEVVVLDTLVVDSAAGLGSLVTRLGAGAAPQGLCMDSATNGLFVKNFLDRTVTSLATDALLRFGDKTVASAETSTVAFELLPAQVRTGKAIFYGAGDPRMSGEGYMSCATCHLDGGHDGRVWDFTGRGEGLRNTTTLRGRGGMAHGNVHWSANFDEIQDFENDVRGAFGGSGFLTDGDFAATADPLGPPKAGLDADLDALAAYVSSLGAETLPKSPFRQPDGAMTAEADSGRTIFRNLGCFECHGGPAFTDSALGTAVLHDVGTLRSTSGQRLGAALTGIDTPTLLGVWNAAPYFHDGSAPTLEDVFKVAGGTLVPAESGTVSGGANIVDQWVELNNDDTVRGRAYVGFNNGGHRLTLNGVDGGSGGLGAVEIRFSASYGNQALEVAVNGVPHAVTLPSLPNDPQWRQTYWEVLRIEDVSLTAGATNTIQLTASSGGGAYFAIDDLLVTTADHRTAAQPHRQVLALPPTDQAALLAYLRQLDGTPEANPTSAFLFGDGFESGNAGAWDRVVP